LPKLLSFERKKATEDIEASVPQSDASSVTGAANGQVDSDCLESKLALPNECKWRVSISSLSTSLRLGVDKTSTVILLLISEVLGEVNRFRGLSRLLLL